MESGNLTDPTAVVDLADRARFLCKYTLQESAVINRVVFCIWRALPLQRTLLGEAGAADLGQSLQV